MGDIHQSAVVDDGARIGAGVRIGPYAIVERDVVLEDNVIVGSHVVLSGHTTVGAGTTIHPFAAIGGQPQDTSYKGEPTTVVIGPNCIIREHATVHRGTVRGRGETRVGASCFLMIGSHVAHDCLVGDRVDAITLVTPVAHWAANRRLDVPSPAAQPTTSLGIDLGL